MLTKQDIWAVAQEQLALDLGCAPALLDGGENAVFEWKDLPGRRKRDNAAPFLEIAVINGKLAAACHRALLPWAEEALLPRTAEWLFLPQNYRKIEAGLAPFGYEIGDARHFSLPDPSLPFSTPRSLVRWYEGDALEQFRENDTWDEALAFNEFTPDVLAVASLDKSGALAAMAGASRDSETMWQIGIRVLPGHQGEGLGANLVALLKDELLRREIVPFYNTADSHISSQNVGLNAGFRPAFGYLYAQRATTRVAPTPLSL